jgi:7-cyano-7-deazaguanine synthase
MTSIVLLSGGIDSTVALAHAQRAGEEVIALTVNYGQRAFKQELHYAAVQTDRRAIRHHIIDARFYPLMGNSALTNPRADLPATPADRPDATFVPMRNTILTSIAAALAFTVGANRIVLAATADDQAGYPDCRPEWVQAMSRVLDLGSAGPAPILLTPLRYMTKRDVVKLGQNLGVDLSATWSCYDGGSAPCGRCGACAARAAAFG